MLYLPISRNAIGTVLSATDAAELDAASNGLRRAEIAALLLIQKSGRQPDPMLSQQHSARQLYKALERQLAQFIEVGNELPQATLHEYFCSNYDPETLQQGLSRLDTINVGLMSDDEAARQDYITATGGWDFGYRSTQLPQHRPPADEQQRILSEVRADRDEPLDVAGLAGTGKTLAIENISAELDSQRLLLVAPTSQQLAGITQRLSGPVQAMTIGRLASATLREHHYLKYDADTEGRLMHRLGLSDAALVSMMGYTSIGDLNAKQVAACVARMISKYCHSGDANIGLKHIPVQYQDLPRADRDLFKAMALEYWRLLHYPDARIKLPLREYHLVKMLSLTELPLPTHYSHLIVDEAHELSKPALQILDRSSQTSITFGDQYQLLRHRAAPKRHEAVRRRYMTQSFRAGDNSAPLYNRLLAAHPSAPAGEFSGDRSKKTRIRYYASFTVPDDYCALLTRSNWQLFALMQRLLAAQARFHLLPGARRDLDSLIGGALELFHGSSRPSHRQLRQHDHWQDFIKAQSEPIVAKVETAFRNGYRSEDLERALASSEPTASADCYIIGRIADAKNHEFSRVILTPDVLLLEDSSTFSEAERINHVYTGISRARDEIMLPEQLRDLLDLSKC